MRFIILKWARKLNKLKRKETSKEEGADHATDAKLLRRISKKTLGFQSIDPLPRRPPTMFQMAIGSLFLLVSVITFVKSAALFGRSDFSFAG